MDRIEKSILKSIITDAEFAAYLLQRIDIGDFDDDSCNLIYGEIITLDSMGIKITPASLLQRFPKRSTEYSIIVELLLCDNNKSV